jgi:AcrR family transcriptional regulator
MTKIEDAAADKKKASRTKRRPGRPHAKNAGNVSRTTILRAAMKLAIKTPLQDISIVTVAKSMNVTPALIHYYIGGRDWLTSGVMNLFYKDLLRKWPEEKDDWRDDLEAAIHCMYEQFARYAGIAAYVVSNSRFRVFQLTAFGDRDYGVELLDRFTGLVRKTGLSAERTGIYASQMIDFVTQTGHSAALHLYPAEHRAFLDEKASKLDETRYPNISFARFAPMEIDGKLAIREGLDLFFLGIATEISGLTLSDAIDRKLSEPRSAPR